MVAPGNHQVLPRGYGERQHLPRPDAGRDPRTARRERLRQIDPHQDPVRCPTTGPGIDTAQGAAGAPGKPGGGTAHRNRHRLPGILARSVSDGCREHLPRAAPETRRPVVRRLVSRHRRRHGDPWRTGPDDRPEDQGRRPVGGRAATGRDRESPVPESESAHSRRADDRLRVSTRSTCCTVCCGA